MAENEETTATNEQALLSQGEGNAGQAGTQSPDFSNLFGEYADNPSIKKFKRPQDLAKSYIELQRTIGKKRIPYPENEEELSQVLSELGRPESPDKYELPEDAKVLFEDDTEANRFREIAHKAGLLPQQYKVLLDEMKGIVSASQEELQARAQEQQQQALQTLQKEWGSALKENLTAAQSFTAKLPETLQQKIVQTGLGNDPEFIKMMADIAKNYSEGNMPNKINLTPADAKRELETIMSNPKHPYFDKYNPEHQAAVDYVTALNQQIYGT